MVRAMELSPERLALRMAEEGIRRAWIVHDPEHRVHHASHPLFEEIAEALGSNPLDRHAHEGIFFQVASGVPTLLTAFVHRTLRGQAQG